MAEVNLPYSTNATDSPPPNCAICLGPCTNKCFSDSCMHQFCFKCLLQWSKVKAVCPLCKQPFTSIIHNVKSNSEYDEHFIQTEDVQQTADTVEDDFLILPNAPPSRHFQFRTTFTVDPRGELAIQQMLLTHPLTNSVYMPDYYSAQNHRFGRYRRRDTSSTAFRRNIYLQDFWVTAQPDITGRYREVSPYFYRDNPAARNRLVPWLNRELNALLEENTQQVMYLVDIILEHLYYHHIRSRFFKNTLREYLGRRTDHFIHEFYSFMRSPFDMIGYDRNVFYSPRTIIETISGEDDSDSDVAVTETTQANTNFLHRPTIEVIEINSDSSRDSDVIIHEPTPPVIINLADSESDNVNLADTSCTENNTNSDNKSSNISHKREHNNKKLKEKHDKIKKRAGSKQKSSKYLFLSSNSEASDFSCEASDTSYERLKRRSSSSPESSDRFNYKYSKRKWKHLFKKCSRSKLPRRYSETSSDDNEPLAAKVRRVKESETTFSGRYKKEKSKKSKKNLDVNIASKSSKSSDSRIKGTCNAKYTSSNTSVPSSSTHSNSSETSSTSRRVKSENNSKSLAETSTLHKVDSDYFAGTSNGKPNSKVKKEKFLWYSRPYTYDTDSSVD